MARFLFESSYLVYKILPHSFPSMRWDLILHIWLNRTDYDINQKITKITVCSLLMGREVLASKTLKGKAIMQYGMFSFLHQKYIYIPNGPCSFIQYDYIHLYT